MPKQLKSIDKKCTLHNIKLLTPYTKTKDVHTIQCLYCNHVWDSKLHRIFYDGKNKCPKCYEMKLQEWEKNKFPIPHLPDTLEKGDVSYIRNKSLYLYLIYYKGSRCEHCGLNLIDNPILADFHHHTKDKTDEIGKLILSHKLDEVLTEVEVCTLLCSNCHRTLHGYSTKYKKYEEYIKKNALDYFR